MKTITQKIYTFDELDKDTQANVIQAWREGNDYLFLNEVLTEYAKELFDNHNIEILNDDFRLYYSLSYSQGDGVCIDGHFEVLDSDNNVTYNIYRRQRGGYTHEHSHEISIYRDYTDNEGNFIQDEEVDCKDKKFIETDDFLIELCQKIERYGYSLIESENEDKTIIENIKSNEYEFFKDGTIYTGL